jgi:hypothetical protein
MMARRCSGINLEQRRKPRKYDRETSRVEGRTHELENLSVGEFSGIPA